MDIKGKLEILNSNKNQTEIESVAKIALTTLGCKENWTDFEIVPFAVVSDDGLKIARAWMRFADFVRSASK